MFVSDWMTKRVFTVSPDDSISDAARLLKEKGIKHIPVVKGEKIRGILSDRDIKEYVPSKATSLDVYELHYLLSKTRVREVMKSDVITVSPDIPIEEAAMIMYDNCIGCLPVVDRKRLAGIISDRDIFRVLVDITGIRHGGHRISSIIEDKPGSIKVLADIIRKHGFSLQSILTSYEGAGAGYRNVVIRTKNKGNFRALKEELEGDYGKIEIIKG
ncbi:hypoxic response protein 1 [bacterium BMS3Bbin05]|nr:hypoxic response protein 1 [bacterium BMS3Bbin05]